MKALLVTITDIALQGRNRAARRRDWLQHDVIGAYLSEFRMAWGEQRLADAIVAGQAEGARR